MGFLNVLKCSQGRRDIELKTRYFEHCRCKIKVSTSSALSLRVGLSLISKHWKSQAVAIWLAHNITQLQHNVPQRMVQSAHNVSPLESVKMLMPASGLQGQSTSKQGLGQYQAINSGGGEMQLGHQPISTASAQKNGWSWAGRTNIRMI